LSHEPTPHSCFGRLNIIMMTIFLKPKYRFNTNPIKILVAFVFTIDKLIFKFLCKYRDPQKPKQSQKKNKVGELHFPIYKLTTKLL
jgi:hypothetical protein